MNTLSLKISSIFITLLLLILTPSLYVEITVAAASQQSTNSGSMSFSHDLSSGSNRAVVIGVSIEANGNIGRTTSITYGGVVMHPIPSSFASINPGSYAISTELFYLLEAELPASGSQIILISHDGNDATSGALQLIGVKQTTPEAVATHALTSSSSISASLSTLTANALLVDIAGGGHPQGRASLQAAAGQTSYWGASAKSSQGGGSTRLVGNAGSYTQEWLMSGMNRAAFSVAAFAPAAGGEPTNQSPVLNPIGNQSLQEGASQNITITATDADGDVLEFSSPALPSYATFTDNGNNTATLALAPQMGDAGTSSITINVTDNTNASVTETINIEVTTEPVNQPPVLNSIGNQSVQEGSSQSITITATDVDGDSLDFGNPALPSYATLTDNGNNTATLTLSPQVGDQGTDTITINVSDGNNVPVSEIFTVIVTVPPGEGDVITLGATSQQATSDGSLIFNHALSTGTNRVVVVGVGIEAKGSDAARTTTIIYGGVAMHAIPNSFAFIKPGNFSFSTELFYLLDNELLTSGNTSIEITHNGVDVNAGAIQLNGVVQGDPEAVATNAFNSPSSMSTAITTLSNNALILDVAGGGHPSSRAELQADANQTSYWSASADSSQSAGSTRQVGTAGSYTQLWNTSDMNRGAHSVVAFAPTSGGTPVNQSPVLATIADQAIVEGTTEVVTITATDVDNDVLVFSSTALPSYATLVDNSDGTATLTLAPAVGATSSSITIEVTDGVNAAVAQSFNVAVTGVPVNQAPVLDPIGNQSLQEGTSQSITITATDADGDTLILSSTTLPSYATFADNGNNTATLALAPQMGDAGTSTITISVADGTNPAVTETIDIEVTTVPVNQPPVLNTIGNQSLQEGDSQSITITATDVDGDTLNFGSSNYPLMRASLTMVTTQQH